MINIVEGVKLENGVRLNCFFNNILVWTCITNTEEKFTDYFFLLPILDKTKICIKIESYLFKKHPKHEKNILNFLNIK